MAIAALSKNYIFMSIQDVSVDINESLMLIYLIAGPRPFRKGAIPEKIQTGGLSTYVLEKDPWNFKFVTLPLEIHEKIKLHPWQFHKIVLHPLEFPKRKSKTDGNSTLFFLNHLWKFHFFFYWPMEFLIPLEIPCPHPPRFFFLE